MLQKTHLAIGVFFILVLISFVEYKWIFVLAVLVGTYLPDIDSRYSKLGHRKIARLLQVFTKHRGMIHSFTFLLTLCIFLIIIFPRAVFGFFLGYALHLFVDSFTKDGITPFYPWKKKSSGKIKSGGRIEVMILVLFVILDIALVFDKVFGGVF